MRAAKHLVLPEEDAAEFAGLAAALLAELAPVGALQAVLARRVAVAAWRLARADRIEADLLQERSYARPRRAPRTSSGRSSAASSRPSRQSNAPLPPTLRIWFHRE